MKVIAGSSNKPLAQSIAAQLNLSCANIELDTFSNKEKRVRITDSLQGEDVIVVQSFSDSADENIIETLLIIDALERMGARHITLVIPWMGYSLQDKVFRPGEPIAAKVVADLLSGSHIQRVLLLDLHNSSIPGFFSVPCQHLSADELFAKHIADMIGGDTNNTVIASPDFGGIKRARSFANILDLDLVNIDKNRDLTSGKVSVESLHGDVAGKTVILFDDVILSGSTALQTAKEIKRHGAQAVHFVATHALLTGDAARKLDDPALDSVIMSNSIYHHKAPAYCTTLDVAPVFAKALEPWLLPQ